MRRMVHRRPELEGAERIDRRAAFRTLRWGAKANRDLTGYQRGVIKGVVTAAGTYQYHLHEAGLADSPVCPFCDSGETEDAPHVLWRCQA